METNSKSLFLPLDTKSLYLNIYNDNPEGHTCTVSTPIKQGKTTNAHLNKLTEIDSSIEYESDVELIHEMIKHSKSDVRIIKVFIVDRVSVNNVEVSTEKKYCFYIKEEVDKTKKQFGRIKLHYPITLRYDKLNIDNKAIINTISAYVKNYAFVVNSFDYYYTQSRLNFNVDIVGCYHVPYSKVFKNGKGKNAVFYSKLKRMIFNYDNEVYSINKHTGEKIGLDDYEITMQNNYVYSKQIVQNHLLSLGAIRLRDVSALYPSALYDISCYIDGEYSFFIVAFTSTPRPVFMLSGDQYQFINDFPTAKIILVSNIYTKNEITIIDREHLSDYKVTIDLFRFYK